MKPRIKTVENSDLSADNKVSVLATSTRWMRQTAKLYTLFSRRICKFYPAKNSHDGGIPTERQGSSPIVSGLKESILEFACDRNK
jgi:hypothetical protein